MTASFWDLAPGEEELIEADEFYYRQCATSAMDEGEPSAQIFSESSKDAGKISGARSSKTTAEDAFLHRAAQGGADKVATCGTYGLTVEQINEVACETGLPVRAVDDSAIAGPEAPPGHTYIDQRHLGEKPRNPDKRQLRAALYLKAMKHPRQWPQ